MRDRVSTGASWLLAFVGNFTGAMRWTLARLLVVGPVCGSLVLSAGCSSHDAKKPDVGDIRQQKAALTGNEPDQSVIPASESRLAAGMNATCMILGNGSLKCWGSNGHFQLGVGPGGDRGHDAAMMGSMLPAVPLGTGLSARSVAVSNFQTCALLSDSSVECWGTNEYGALGNGEGAVTIGDQWGEPGNQALRVPLGPKVRSLVAGADSFFCAIVDTGDVRCWGNNRFGQLGVGGPASAGADGGTTSVATTGKVDLGGHIATAIAAGGDHACAILETGGVRCWGANGSGQLGTGDTTNHGDSSDPAHAITDATLDPGRTAVAIVAGRAHTCVRLDDGAVKCWGDNSLGQLGIGDTTVHGGSGTSALGEGLPAVNFGTKRTARSLTAGADHTCAILDTGELKCWGKNDVGQLGIESTANQGATTDTIGDPNPGGGVAGMLSVSLGTLRTPRAVVAGGNHTCAWLDDGSVKCWGSNEHGESGLGYNAALHGAVAGTMGDKLAAVPLRQTVTSSPGSNHNCSVLEDGSVKCWGANDSGQLGIGTTGQGMGLAAGQMAQITPVNLGKKALSVATGRAHSCALLEDHTVKCWGANNGGQLGLNSTTPAYIASVDPMAPPINLAGHLAKSISAAWDTNCAILDDDSLRCWGSGIDYILGNGSTASIGLGPTDQMSTLPVVIPGSSPKPIAVSMGVLHACALLEDGTVKCWGQNQYYQTGIGVTTLYQKTPPANGVAIGGPATAIAAGEYQTCALLKTGVVSCWGSNTWGQLGIDSTAYQGVTTAQISPALVGPALPSPLPPGPPVVAIANGAPHVCAMFSTGAVRCWGDGAYGEVGPPPSGSGTPSYVGDAPGEMEALADLSLGTGASAVGITSGIYHNCALLNDGRVKCWGRTTYGEIGIGSRGTNDSIGYYPTDMGDNLKPAQLGVSYPALSVVSGDYFNCAILENGPVKCWGKNDAGQLGIGVNDPNRGSTAAQMGSALPSVLLGSGRSARMLAAGARHACALLDNGNVKCWGANDSGQLGLGDNAVRGSGANQMGDNLPIVQLGTGRTAIAITAGTAHTCALLEEGDVFCWGANAQGQLGVGNATPVGATANQMGDALVDVRFGKGLKPLAIAAERNHTCVLLNNGSVRCWGDNTNGDLGIDKPDQPYWGDQPNELGTNMPVVDLGTTTPGSNPPGPPTAAVLIAPSCAVLQDGNLKCWGDNTSGQLGLGTMDTHGVMPGDMGDNLFEIAFGGPHVLGLAARDDHKCAVLDDGTLECWGNNANDQLGLFASPDPGTTSQPGAAVPLGTGRNTRKVSVGLLHTCALVDDGTVKCWGNNADGELGIGTTTPQTNVLVPVSFGDTDIWNGAAPNATGTGQCANLNDNNACTLDTCDPATGVTHTRICNAQCPCSGADGVCTSDSDCASGDVCGVNNGTFFGHQRSDRLCWGSTCSQTRVSPFFWKSRGSAKGSGSRAHPA